MGVRVKVRVKQAAGPPPEVVVREGIPILRYSTSDLPAAERYRDWYERSWPRSGPIYRTEPFEPFNTSWETAQLGPVTFLYTEITGMRWERRLEDIRTSDFDPIIISMMIDGMAHGDLDGRAFRETAGTFHFHDLARPSLHVSTASRTYSLVVPRPVAAEWFAPLHDLHGLVVGPDAAAMLFSHAAHVRRDLPRFDLAQADQLGRVFLELVALTLAVARPVPQARISAEDALRQRGVEEIEKRLGSGEVAVAELCLALGVPKRRLFAAFRPDGGVQAYVMTERLKRARNALSDLERAEPIGNIAHRLGFSDAPHLSRAFRQRYGMTPRDYRRLVAKDADLRQSDGEAEPLAKG
jgi:AraC-like DNA-binding protein